MRRHGIAILEVSVAFVLTGMLVALSLQVLVAASVERRAVERRTVALEEAANLAEKIAAMPWDKVTPEELARIPLAPAVKAILPKSDLKLSVETSSSALPAKHIRIEIAWDSAAGLPESPVSLDYWAFEPAGGKTP